MPEKLRKVGVGKLIRENPCNPRLNALIERRLTLFHALTRLVKLEEGTLAIVRSNRRCASLPGALTMSKKDDREAQPKMKTKHYEKELRKLQTELCRLQEWVKHKGLRVIVVFEGRDAAGKGGTIKAITERVSPRVFRLVALPAPSDREKSQMYMQRYMQHFPAAGEVVIFDRSWYNRAGVEKVMGFCSEDQYRDFLVNCPAAEKYIVDGGIMIIKFWLEVGKKEQERRFAARVDDPLRQWKLSPMDVESWTRWYDYSRARDKMLEATDTKHAPGMSCVRTTRNEPA